MVLNLGNMDWHTFIHNCEAEEKEYRDGGKDTEGGFMLNPALN
jgi:hypothetical protein